MNYPITNNNPRFFYDISDFPFLDPLTNGYPLIRKELYELLSQKDKSWFSTYPSYVKSENTNAWQVFTFMLWHIKSKENASICPTTANLVFSIPEITSCDFSSLKPHTHIKPHTGYSKTVLRCHLPLIIPKGDKCAIRVGDQTRRWKEGELLIFDDSFDHEAWNFSDENRIVLMFDIPNPNWNYSAQEITKYSIEHIKDKFLLSLASKEKWQEMYIRGYFF